jgi:hypothetical protein
MHQKQEDAQCLSKFRRALTTSTFEEMFDTNLEALERTKSWTRAKLGDVVIVTRGRHIA